MDAIVNLESRELQHFKPLHPLSNNATYRRLSREVKSSHLKQIFGKTPNLLLKLRLFLINRQLMYQHVATTRQVFASVKLLFESASLPTNLKTKEGTQCYTLC